MAYRPARSGLLGKKLAVNPLDNHKNARMHDLLTLWVLTHNM